MKKNNFIISDYNSKTARSKKEKLRRNTTLSRQSVSYSQNGTPVSGSLNNSDFTLNNNNVNSNPGQSLSGRTPLFQTAYHGTSAD